MPLVFHGSPEHTIGVEIEFQLVDRDTRELVSVGPKLLSEIGEADWVKPELLQSTIEINTKVCQDIREVEVDLEKKISRVRELADRSNAALVACGTHPFSKWSDQDVTENDRYHRLVERMQWPAQRLVIFGLHAHVGVADGETAIAVVNQLERWLPHLLAISASSPFWEGRDTGLASARAKIFEGLPTAGLPYVHNNWSDFEKLIDALVKAQAIETIREIWWDVRPHPRFGTVEVRICDAVPTLYETLAIVSLIQALVVQLSRQAHDAARHKILHNRIVRENKWRALRWSTLGSTIVDETGSVEPIPKSVADLLEELRPVFSELGSEAQLPRLRQILNEGPSYARQRAVFERTGDLGAVVDLLIKEGETDQPFHFGTPA